MGAPKITTWSVGNTDICPQHISNQTYAHVYHTILILTWIRLLCYFKYSQVGPAESEGEILGRRGNRERHYMLGEANKGQGKFPHPKWAFYLFKLHSKSLGFSTAIRSCFSVQQAYYRCFPHRETIEWVSTCLNASHLNTPVRPLTVFPHVMDVFVISINKSILLLPLFSKFLYFFIS